MIGNDDSSLWVCHGEPGEAEPDIRSPVSNPDEVDTVIRRYLYHTDEDPTELTIEQQANRVKPSVIKVQTPAGLGSGVIINEDGYAITNAHVIQGETDLRTTIWLPTEDGKSRRTTLEDIEIVAVNNHLDLAPETQASQQRAVPILPVGIMGGIVVGQPVMVIGNPLGLEQTTRSESSRPSRGIPGPDVHPDEHGHQSRQFRWSTVQHEWRGHRHHEHGDSVGEGLNFAIPTRYVKDFIRNREAFAYDIKNPNSGHNYHVPPGRTADGVAKELNQ